MRTAPATLSISRLLAVAALATAFLERWVIVHPVLWTLAALLVPTLLGATRRLGAVKFGAPLTLFCALVPASFVWNDDLRYSYRALLTFAAFLVIALWLVVRETPTSALGLVAAAAAITAVASIGVAFAAPDLIEQSNPGSFQGIFTHKNWLALAMGYLFLAVMYGRVQRAPVRWMALIAASTLLVLAQSNGAFIALAITVLVFSVGAWEHRWISSAYRRIVELLVLGVLVILALIGLQRLYTVATALGEGHDIDRRLQLWGVTLSYAAERPLLGWGWRGSWSNSRGVTGDIVRDMGGFPAAGAHNGYLDVFLQVGLIGLLLLVTLLLRVIWPPLNDPALRGWSALALFSAIFTLSDSFLAGHIPILVIVTGWLFGRNPHLWQPSTAPHVEGTKGTPPRPPKQMSATN